MAGNITAAHITCFDQTWENFITISWDEVFSHPKNDAQCYQTKFMILVIADQHTKYISSSTVLQSIHSIQASNLSPCWMPHTHDMHHVHGTGARSKWNYRWNVKEIWVLFQHHRQPLLRTLPVSCMYMWAGYNMYCPYSPLWMHSQ